MEENNKNTLAIVIILILVGLVWFYTTGPKSELQIENQTASHKFVGTFLDGDSSRGLTLLGNFIKEDEEIKTTTGLITVIVVPKESATITRAMITLNKFERGDGLSKPLDPSKEITENVDIKQLLADIKSYNPVLTVTTTDDIYNQKEFNATNIQYSVIIYK